MNDIIESLENLGPDELRAVSNLINKLAKRKARDNSDDTGNPELAVETKETKETKKRNISSKNNSDRRGRGSPRTEPRTQRNIAKSSKRGGRKGNAARTEPVSLSKINKFETMRERNDFRSDSEIDKKLWGNRKPSERPQKFEYAEVQCKSCNRWFDINPELVLVDYDTGDYVYTCDNCIGRGKE